MYIIVSIIRISYNSILISNTIISNTTHIILTTNNTSGLFKQQRRRHNHHFIVEDPAPTQHGADTWTYSSSGEWITTGHNSDQYSEIVFLTKGTVMPDTVSLLLMRAGDIESNPGPSKCRDCGHAFNHQSKPISCCKCDGRFCRIARGGQKTTCIGLTRWKLEKDLEMDKPIICRLCKGDTPRKVNEFNV